MYGEKERERERERERESPQGLDKTMRLESSETGCRQVSWVQSRALDSGKTARTSVCFVQDSSKGVQWK